MKKQAIIFDPPHGKETPGKRSPDNSHIEYLWGRSRIIGVINRILLLEKQKGRFNFDMYYPLLCIWSTRSTGYSGLKGIIK